MTTLDISTTSSRRRRSSMWSAPASATGFGLLALSLAACTGPADATPAASPGVQAAPPAVPGPATRPAAADEGVIAADHDITDADGGFIGRLRVYPDDTTEWIIPPD